MLSSGVLDVAIGLIMLYGLLSAAASTFVELVASAFAWRANDLEAGIRIILGGSKTWTMGTRVRWFLRGGGFAGRSSAARPVEAGAEAGEVGAGARGSAGRPSTADAVLEHSLVGGMVPTRRDRPSYVSARSFTLALFDVVTGKTAVSLTSVVEALRGEGAIPEPIRAALQPLVESAHTLDEARGNVEHWFNAQMDRLSGLYKRRTQLWLFLCGVGFAGAFNLDTFEVARKLATDAAAGAAVVAAAQARAARADALVVTAPATAAGGSARAMGSVPAVGSIVPVPAGSTVSASIAAAPDEIEHTRAEYARLVRDVREMTSSGFVVGWNDGVCPADGSKSCAWSWVSKILGILVTALTTVMGASTWFSALGKLLALRSSVKPEPKGE